MLTKINACRTPEELHHIGTEIDMSLADKSVKKPLYEDQKELILKLYRMVK